MITTESDVMQPITAPERLNVKPSIASQSEPPMLNRAQRRALSRYIAAKARRQTIIVKRRHNLVDRGRLCKRCGLAFLGGSGDRCQCKVAMGRQG